MSFDYKRINLTIIDQLRSICERSTDQWADKDNLAVDMIIEAINIARGYARLEKKKVGAFWELWGNGGYILFFLTAPFAVLVLLYMWVDLL